MANRGKDPTDLRDYALGLRVVRTLTLTGNLMISNVDLSSVLSAAGSLLSVAGSFAASFMGAWLAARFALHRFYREKVWERKTAAYTAIFDALHRMDRWFEVHIHEARTGHDLSEEYRNNVTDEYNKAKDELKRRLDSEVWLIPIECRRRIERLMRELGRQHEYWDDMLGSGQAAIASARDDLTKSARIDLRLERKSLLQRS